MADAPEVLLNRALAQLLAEHELAVDGTNPDGTILERGMRIDGIMPTSAEEFTLLTPLRPIPDGRTDILYRTQFYTRRLGGFLVAREWAASLRAVLDQQEYTPNVLGISWSWEFSGLDIEPDTQKRAATVATYHFRGRRP